MDDVKDTARRSRSSARCWRRGPRAPTTAIPWFGRDKALHFGASAVLASGGYAATAS